MPSEYFERFQTYFRRDVAEQAAKSIKNGSEMEFEIRESGDSGEKQAREVFTFTREGGRNSVVAKPASDPQLVFTLSPGAADAILSDISDDIGTIGVNIMKLIMSNDPARRVSVKIKAGFLSLFTKGYFGVLTAGGSAISSYLASKGFNGMGAIKAALKKIKE